MVFDHPFFYRNSIVDFPQNNGKSKKRQKKYIEVAKKKFKKNIAKCKKVGGNQTSRKC